MKIPALDFSWEDAQEQHLLALAEPQGLAVLTGLWRDLNVTIWPRVRL